MEFAKATRRPVHLGILVHCFQSIPVFPFWLFNANDWENTQIKENVTISTLPPRFYTEASLVVSGVATWVWLRKTPARKSSSFPWSSPGERRASCGDIVGVALQKRLNSKEYVERTLLFDEADSLNVTKRFQCCPRTKTAL